LKKVQKPSRQRKRSSYLTHNEVKVKVPEDYPWMLLGRLTEDLAQFLPNEDVSRVHAIVRSRNLEKLFALGSEWGLQSITPVEELTTPLVRCRYQIASLIKKYQFPTERKSREATAKLKFINAEATCRTYNHSGYKEFCNGKTDWAIDIFTYARSFLSKLLGAHPAHPAVLDMARHGPGSNLDTKNGLTSVYEKYRNWPYSCTRDAIPYARFAIATDQRWLGALQDSYRRRMGIPTHYPIDEEVFWSAVIRPVKGNRICFVPKDAQTERTIAIEPAINLYLQLGVDGFIRRRLKRYGVNLDDQVKNQKLARVGSKRGTTGGYSTLDLSAASDTISLKLCEMLLPPDWYSYLVALRSPCGELGETETFSYEKISSMGNGYTFALESAIFTALVFAVFKADDLPFDHEEFAVYGDDIIVPTELTFKVVEALRLAGFSLNLDKSFVFGPVRESCGADWYQGLHVRPVFITEYPQTVFDLFCDHNRLRRSLDLYYGIGDESKVLSLIRKWIPEKLQNFKGPLSDEDFDSYLHTTIPCTVNYRMDGMFRWPRLLVKPLPLRKDKSFFFRKLMHNLRDRPRNTPWDTNPWNIWEERMGKGNRFTVTARNRQTVCRKFSISSFWRDEYTLS